MSSTSNLLTRPKKCRKKKPSQNVYERLAQKAVTPKLKPPKRGRSVNAPSKVGKPVTNPAASISKKSNKSSKKQANKSAIPLSVKRQFTLLDPEDFAAIEALPEPTMEELRFWLVESVEAMGDSPAVHAGFAQSARCAISLFAKIQHKEAA